MLLQNAPTLGALDNIDIAIFICDVICWLMLYPLWYLISMYHVNVTMEFMKHAAVSG